MPRVPTTSDQTHYDDAQIARPPHELVFRRRPVTTDPRRNLNGQPHKQRQTTTATQNAPIVIQVRNIHGLKSSTDEINRALEVSTNGDKPDILILTETNTTAIHSSPICDYFIAACIPPTTSKSGLGRPSGGALALVHDNYTGPVHPLKVKRAAETCTFVILLADPCDYHSNPCPRPGGILPCAITRRGRVLRRSRKKS